MKRAISIIGVILMVTSCGSTWIDTENTKISYIEDGGLYNENISGVSSSYTNLPFPSNAVSARPTLENGKQVKEVVAQNQQASYSINAVNSSNNQNIALIVKKVNNIIQQMDMNFYSINEVFNETESCSNGGSMTYNANGSETGGAKVTTTFNSCNEDGTTINGKVLSTLSNYNSLYDDYTNIDSIYLSDLTMSSYTLNIRILKDSTSKIQISNIYGPEEAGNMKIEVTTISEINGVKTGQYNSVYYFDLSSYYSTIMYQTSGKIYIDNLASYVTYDTSYDMSKTPFVFDSYGLTSGQARYNMANGGKVKIIAESNQAKTYVDANGDGTYELSE